MTRRSTDLSCLAVTMREASAPHVELREAVSTPTDHDERLDRQLCERLQQSLSAGVEFSVEVHTTGLGPGELAHVYTHLRNVMSLDQPARQGSIVDARDDRAHDLFEAASIQLANVTRIRANA